MSDCASTAYSGYNANWAGCINAFTTSGNKHDQVFTVYEWSAREQQRDGVLVLTAQT